MTTPFSWLPHSGLLSGTAYRAGADADGSPKADTPGLPLWAVWGTGNLFILLSVVLQNRCQQLSFAEGATTMPILIFFFLNNCSVLVPLKGLYVFLIKNKINIKRVVRGAVGRKPILYWLFGLEVDSQKQFMRNSRPWKHFTCTGYLVWRPHGKHWLGNTPAHLLHTLENSRS